MDSARALVAKGRGIALVSRTMGVSRAQLSLRINRSADWQDRRCNRRNEEADAEILSAILNIISDMPSYGYRRVWGILRKQRRTEGQPPVNAKRLYRIMSEHNLLLLHHKPERPKREHKGKIAVAESDMRWCSDGFEFGCDNGEKLRVTFALDCCDREAIDWAASTGGYDSSTVQDVMLRSVEKRFGELYAIEAEIRGMPETERLAARQSRSAPLLASLHEWMVEKSATLSKKSRLGEAFTYALNQWDALCYYCRDGLAEPDNNAAERALRAVCLGKKNYIFFGSDHGGERGALLYGLIGTCRLNGIDKEAYLRHILSVLPEWPSNRVGELLPWNVAIPA